MAQETISTAILIIAGIIATVALVNAVYPSLFTATGSVGSVSDTASDRVKTDIRISMSSLQNESSLYVWVKNTGSTEIPAGRLDYTDVYFGDAGSMARAETAGAASFRWSYVLDDTDGDGNWGPGETLQVLVSETGSSHLTPGTHIVKLVLYNSASVEDTVTI
jgi:flagellar protein FlaG